MASPKHITEKRLATKVSALAAKCFHYECPHTLAPNKTKKQQKYEKTRQQSAFSKLLAPPKPTQGASRGRQT